MSCRESCFVFPDQSSPGLSKWDPMQEDFLSKRNCYSYDDEDAGCVIMGYSELIYSTSTLFAFSQYCSTLVIVTVRRRDYQLFVVVRIEGSWAHSLLHAIMVCISKGGAQQLIDLLV